jgi:hypothetical protein
MIPAAREKPLGDKNRGQPHPTPCQLTSGIVTAILACGPTGGQVARGMKKISYKGYRFPPEIIQQAIWLYLRFTLSFRMSKTYWRNAASWSPTRPFGAG